MVHVFIKTSNPLRMSSGDKFPENMKKVVFLNKFAKNKL